MLVHERRRAVARVPTRAPVEWGGRVRGSAGGSRGGTAAVEDAVALIDRGTRAQEVEGDLRAGREWFEAAYQEAERTGHPELMARAVLGSGGIWLHEHRTAAAAGLM